MMQGIEKFRRLICVLEAYADFNDKHNTNYACGKASAYRIAAQWLRRECDSIESEWSDNDA